MRRATVGLMERHAIAEELARKFYAHLGYSNLADVPADYMSKSTHPQEEACYAMACTAIRYFCDKEGDL